MTEAHPHDITTDTTSPQQRTAGMEPLMTFVTKVRLYGRDGRMTVNHLARLYDVTVHEIPRRGRWRRSQWEVTLPYTTDEGLERLAAHIAAVLKGMLMSGGWVWVEQLPTSAR